MISVNTHAVIDYVVGVLLILAPFLLGFANGGAAMWVPILLGAGILLYSLVTAYRYSVAKVIPLSVHLGLDAAGGLLLLVSPWLFGFAQLVWWPHVIVGLAELGVVMMTQRNRAAA
ncbi:SPW repeat domain-containing protein [Roseivivax isoporae]|uniref:Membrane protein n=1 Tax=Roseivivax isoporae LMG 25204 TaxID=1449351 RepID=X7F826_9RHOB|nr:SPW repeat protein [Roseivivax isoporae]ETX28950.1 membrane protein [Roseivivax isoporae LMG 25204]